MKFKFISIILLIAFQNTITIELTKIPEKDQKALDAIYLNTEADQLRKKLNEYLDEILKDEESGAKSNLFAYLGNRIQEIDILDHKYEMTEDQGKIRSILHKFINDNKK